MNNSMPQVSIETFTSIIEMQFKENNYRTIFGLGKGGIGKTESIEALANRLSIGYIDIRLLLYSEVDLKGVLYPSEDHTKTVWLQNDVLPNVERDGKRGILVLDEITSTAKSLRTAVYQLINERRLGEYKLPDGWLVVCLGNGEEDGGDFQGMEGNFVNRCSMFRIVPSVEAWKSWGYKNNINDLVLSYVSWRPSHLHTYTEDEECTPFASPRSWEAVSNILNIHGFNEDDTINKLRILSNIGTLVGNQFITFCSCKESIISPEDILNGQTNNSFKSKEALYITVQSLVRLMGDIVQTDKNNSGAISFETLSKLCNGIRWILSLNSLEVKVMGIKDFISTDRKIISKIILNDKFKQMCPQLQTFAEQNAEVFRR